MESRVCIKIISNQIEKVIYRKNYRTIYKKVIYILFMYRNLILNLYRNKIKICRTMGYKYGHCDGHCDKSLIIPDYGIDITKLSEMNQKGTLGNFLMNNIRFRYNFFKNEMHPDTIHLLIDYGLYMLKQLNHLKTVIK